MNAYHRYYRAVVLPQHGRTWLDCLETEGRSVRSLATYAAALVNLRRFLGAAKSSDVGSVIRSDLDSWQEALLTSGCSVSTREQFTRTVRYWFQPKKRS